MLFSSKITVRVTFGVRLVSGYAHVSILLSVVVVTLPNGSESTLERFEEQLHTLVMSSENGTVTHADTPTSSCCADMYMAACRPSEKWLDNVRADCANITSPPEADKLA